MWQQESGSVAVANEVVDYEISTVQARPFQHRTSTSHGRNPTGNIIVIIPGHGQTVKGPRNIVTTAALLSKSKIVWCVDPTPAKGGDRIEAQAIARIVREQISAAFPATKEPIAATIIGWSHGGSEALRAAEYAPDLFTQYLGLCPTGFVDRRPTEFIISFLLEVLRIIGTSLYRWDYSCLLETLRLGVNGGIGTVQDLWRSRSLKRLIEDIDWATRKVSEKPLGYTGEIVLLYGAQDTVIRWKDAFPDCEQAQNIPEFLPTYQKENFPNAKLVDVRVVEGAHIAPEANAPYFLKLGLGLLNQLDAKFC
jgi:pimeloyl-ACP methyl ester carboxylesterase